MIAKEQLIRLYVLMSSLREKKPILPKAGSLFVCLFFRKWNWKLLAKLAWWRENNSYKNEISVDHM